MIIKSKNLEKFEKSSKNQQKKKFNEIFFLKKSKNPQESKQNPKIQNILKKLQKKIQKNPHKNPPKIKKLSKSSKIPKISKNLFKKIFFFKKSNFFFAEKNAILLFLAIEDISL